MDLSIKEFYQRKVKVKFAFSLFLQVWLLLYWMASYTRLVAQMELLLWHQWRSLIRNQTSGYLFVPWEPKGNILELLFSKVQYMQVRYFYSNNMRRFARFATICTILKTGKTSMEEYVDSGIQFYHKQYNENL